MSDKQMQFNIDDGQTFYCDEISITNNQFKFFLDFKNSSPRIDVRSSDVMPIVIKHDVVLMDPALAKLFSKLLSDHITKFEREHGKIPDMPSAENSLPKNISSTDDKPSYLG